MPAAPSGRDPPGFRPDPRHRSAVAGADCVSGSRPRRDGRERGVPACSTIWGGVGPCGKKRMVMTERFRHLLPVVLGGDIGAYALARQLHEVTGTSVTVVASDPIVAISESTYITVVHQDRKSVV